jgi:hypothetical protein
MNRFVHGGDMGDIIYSLPTIRDLGGGELILSPFETYTDLTIEKIGFLTSLLEKQEYIKSVSVGSFVKGMTNLDDFRNKGFSLHKENLAKMYCKTFGVRESVVEKPWLSVGKKVVYGKTVVFCRSHRYHNKGEFWKDIVKIYCEKAVFLGLRSEYESFVKQFNCSYIPFYEVESALEMAEIINGCEMFVGNQSLAYSICEGLKKNAVLEVCPFCPNCCFNRVGVEYGKN